MTTDGKAASASATASIVDLRRAAVRSILSGPLPVPVRRALELIDTARPDAFDACVDGAIARIDELLATQLDAVLHAPAFQRLEASWLGVMHVVEALDFHENVRVALLTCTKAELAHDMEEATEWTRSAVYRHVYTTEYGTFGGEPYAVVLGDMDFSSSPTDLRVLKGMAAIGAAAHAPFFTAASPSLIGFRTWGDIQHARDLAAVFEGPAHVAWNAFRDSPDSRYIGLLLPRVLMRSRHRPTPVAGYTERISAGGWGVLWGNPIYVLAVRMGRMFARHRALTALVGDDYDSVVSFATEPFDALGQSSLKPSIEVVVAPKIERALREVGMIALQQRPNSAHLYVASANSLQRAKRFGNTEKGREATISYLLGTQFPHLLLAARFAHYVKVLERDTLGGHRTADEIETNLDEWLGQYVVNMDSISASMRARYPLRQAKVTVRPAEGVAGGFHAEILLRPHLRYLDAYANLTVSNFFEPR